MGITSWYTVGVNCSYWRTYQWDGDPTAIEVCASHLSLAASCQHYVPQLPRDWIHLGGKGGGGGGRGGGNLTDQLMCPIIHTLTTYITPSMRWWLYKEWQPYLVSVA